MTEKEKLETLYKALCFYRDLNKALTIDQYQEIDHMCNVLYAYMKDNPVEEETKKEAADDKRPESKTE